MHIRSLYYTKQNMFSMQSTVLHLLNFGCMTKCYVTNMQIITNKITEYLKKLIRFSRTYNHILLSSSADTFYNNVRSSDDHWTSDPSEEIWSREGNDVVLCLSLLHMMAPASCWWEQRAKADNTTIPVVDFRDAADENDVCVPAVECGD